jgi:hypothetical protein
MGYAARAKQRAAAAGESVLRGNPEHAPRLVHVINGEERQIALKQGRRFQVRFSDRTYAMDQGGTLRRIQPAPTAGALKYGPINPGGSV